MFLVKLWELLRNASVDRWFSTKRFANRHCCVLRGHKPKQLGTCSSTWSHQKVAQDKCICVKLDAGGLYKYRWCHTASCFSSLPERSATFCNGAYLRVKVHQSRTLRASSVVLQWTEMNLVGLKFNQMKHPQKMNARENYIFVDTVAPSSYIFEEVHISYGSLWRLLLCCKASIHE